MNNSDGAGFCYARDNRIYLSKGYKTFKPFYRAVKNRIEDKDSAILHFRIASVGDITEENCHPFIITDDKHELCRTEVCTTEPVIAHNGSLSIKATKHGKSDTRQFARFLGDPVIRDNLFRRNNLLRLVSNSIGYSRIIIMNRKGIFRKMGDWEKEDGLYYSNRTFKWTSSVVCRKWDYKTQTWIENEDKIDLSKWKVEGAPLDVESDDVIQFRLAMKQEEERLAAEEEAEDKDRVERSLALTGNGTIESLNRYHVGHTKCDMCDKDGEVYYYIDEDMALCDECYALYCKDFYKREEKGEKNREVVEGEMKKEEEK